MPLVSNGIKQYAVQGAHCNTCVGTVLRWYVAARQLLMRLQQVQSGQGYLREAANGLLTNGGKVLQRETMRSELICQILHSDASLHFHLCAQQMASATSVPCCYFESESGGPSASFWQCTSTPQILDQSTVLGVGHLAFDCMMASIIRRK